jgi:hypothetical protein
VGQGLLRPDKIAVITLHDQTLPEGDYNLEALVAIWPSSQARSLRDQLVVMTEEIRVYSY